MNRHAGSPEAVISLDRISIVLSCTSHPGNIGAAARAMKTMGLSRLILVNPKRYPDAEATARAAGAVDILAHAKVCTSLDTALAGSVRAYAVSARQRAIGPPALPARQAAAEIVVATTHGSVALVFGNETSGLANDELQHCQRAVYIPAEASYPSLNLAAAVQILAYEIRLATQAVLSPAASGARRCASSLPLYEEVEAFHSHLERLMIQTGFLDPQRPRRLLPKLRRLFARASLEHEEINILRGFLAAIEHQLPPTRTRKGGSG